MRSFRLNVFNVFKEAQAITKTSLCTVTIAGLLLGIQIKMFESKKKKINIIFLQTENAKTLSIVWLHVSIAYQERLMKGKIIDSGSF